MNLSIPQIDGLQGTRQIPGDKSISHRAMMIGAIAKGITEIQACSQAADPLSTLSCVRQLGLQVETKDTRVIIAGRGIHGLNMSSDPLNTGNSGTTMRLLSGILVGQIFPSMLIGDSSLSKRPMKRILDPLQQMGANIQGTTKDTAPLIIRPIDHLHGIDYELPIPSAQVKSAILFAGLYAEGTTRIYERIQSRDHTERMLGLHSSKQIGGNIIQVFSGTELEGKKFFVPGDISAAAFLLAAALIIPGSELVLHNIGLNPTRRRIVDILKMMGGNIHVDNEHTIEGEPIGDLIVKSSELKSDLDLHGDDIVELIDEIPILSVTAIFADGSFSIHDAKELRTKETDRISAIVRNLRLLGCQVEEFEDGFAFEGNKRLTGARIDSYNDHRIAMAFGVAGLRIPNVTITNADCVDISFPGFWRELFTTEIN